MKRIICMLLALVMCLGLFVGCAQKQVIDGEEAKVLDNQFAIIEEFRDGRYIVYDVNTKVVYYCQPNGYGGYLSPYQIYQDGVVYGAVYENGEIVPKPYAMGITFDMIGTVSKYLD